MKRYQRRLIYFALAVLIASALVGRYVTFSRTYANVHHLATTNPIQHIVFLLKENHTFDNYFGLFPGANGTTTAKVKVGGVVKTIPLTPAVDQPDNFCHGWDCAHGSYDNGQMDNFAVADASKQCTSAPYLCYSEAQPSLIPNYWALAQHFVLSDNTYSSAMTASFTNHLFSVSGASGSSIDTSVTDNPEGTNNWGCDAPSNTRVRLYNGASVYPCFSYKTLADEMQTAGVSWKEYGATGSDAGYKWDTLNAFSQDRNNATIWSHNVDWSQLATDAAKGSLPAFSWVTAPMADSEHPPFSTCAGENWSIQEINAIENSPEWSSTVIIVAWDDWGGFYDHVAPISQDALGYGFRVPLMVISPYAYAGDNSANRHITHDRFELASVLKLAEEVFHLPALTQRDASAGNLLSTLDFSSVHNAPLILNTRTCPAQTAPIKGNFDD